MKKIVVFVILSTFTFLSVLPASADQLTDAKKKKSTIESQMSAVNKKKKEEEKKKKEAEEKQKSLISSENKQKQEFQKVVTQINDLNKEIKTIDDGIAEAEAEYKQQQELFKTRLRVMYESSESSYVQTLIESKNIGDFFQRLQLISMISKKDKDMVEQLEMAKQDVEFKKEEKERQKADVQKRASEKQQVLNDIKVSRADLDQELKAIKKKLDQLEAEEDALERKSNEIADQIRNLTKKSTKKYTGGAMNWPVPSSSQISSYYGNRIHPILKKKKFHSGIDIHAASGASIEAANNGTVLLAGWQSGYGYTVIVDHGGGISTLYAHCSKMLVKVGAEVKSGQVIAKIGSTGLSTGPHLHFEVRKGGSTVDPMSYFK
ncbi:MAG: peptidoglycan DD-metalloendopeptidase family protein [Clostridia bacterium]|nr:peptidoglycan DD-metalloendopeptidase family protein [Clostridia bacterium]